MLSLAIAMDRNLCTLDDMTIPMDSRGNLCIYFPNNTNRVRHISADDILTGQLSEEGIKGKIVLVGLTASGLSQVYQTRSGLVISAVEVQAQAVENIISKIHIQRYPKVILSEIAIALLLTALFSICIGWFGFMIKCPLGSNWHPGNMAGVRSTISRHRDIGVSAVTGSIFTYNRNYSNYI